MDDDVMGRRNFLQVAGALGVAPVLFPHPRAANSAFPRPASTLENPTSEAFRDPVAIHPENPKYFLFRNKPVVLIAASEHYGSVVNRRFDFMRYLAEAADKKQTVTRTFLLYRELQTVRNPYSPIKPESPDFVTPYPRTGPGKAMDGERKYDLDRWNSEYFDRLHRFLSRASELEIIVELTLLSNSYSDSVWSLNPLRSQNNLQSIGNIPVSAYISMRDGKLVERQSDYVRKIIQETSAFDNVYYEICNDPGGGAPNSVTSAEVDVWQEEIARVARQELHKLGRKHLLLGEPAWSYRPEVTETLDASFSGTLLDAVNIHPLPGLIFLGRTYQLGQFMSKELQLREFRDFFLATYQRRKPCISDEDNTASMYRDEGGWTIHRKRAWMAVMCGSHYDYIDFSIQVGLEAGTEDSRRTIRTWMRHLSKFIHSFDFIHARALPNWVKTQPAPLVSATPAKQGEDYITYFADGRELSDSAAGQPIRGPILFDLPEGAYVAYLYSPAVGSYSPGVRLQGGDDNTFEMPSFEQDVVLRVTRQP